MNDRLGPAPYQVVFSVNQDTTKKHGTLGVIFAEKKKNDFFPHLFSPLQSTVHSPHRPFSLDFFLAAR